MFISTLLKYFFCILICLGCIVNSWAQLNICSWNVKNLGTTKTKEQLSIIADIIKDFDIIALQEINTAPNGAQTLASLVQLLQKKSEHKWYYNISDPTTAEIPHEKERYAYIWRKSKDILVKKGYLDPLLQKKISREPFLKEFTYKGKTILLINFHAVPKKKNPAQEIAYFKQYPDRFTHPFILLGDFNVTSTDQVWLPLKKLGYETALTTQKTTLKQKCKQQECLANGLDNMLYHPNQITLLNKGTIPFHSLFFSDVAEARKLSDHLPIFITIDL